MDVGGDYQKIGEMLEATGVAGAPGKLLYSGLGTLKPGALYLLGLNPGGRPDTEIQTIRRHWIEAPKRKPGWSEYLDEVWFDRGRALSPGQAPMQRRVRDLLGLLNANPRDVCASNVIFLRSVTSAALADTAAAARACWPNHRMIIDIVRPAAIVTLGSAAYDAVRRSGIQSGPQRAFDSGHRNVPCRMTPMRFGENACLLISIPHPAAPGNFEPQRHPRTFDVLRGEIERLAEMRASA